jgi:hypothetical protein
MPDGVTPHGQCLAFVKRDCPTCVLVAPVLAHLARRVDLSIFSQDDPAFPPGLTVADDSTLEMSWHYGIEIVPTLIRLQDGVEQARVIGWQRSEWEHLTGVSDLGPDLPAWRPGCGSKTSPRG